MHVNIHHSVPDGLGGMNEVFKCATHRDIKEGMKWGGDREGKGNKFV